jgi:cytochrome P450
VQKLINEVVRMCANVSLANFFPILRPVTQFTSEERKMAATGKRMDAYLQSLLEERRANPPRDEAEKTIVDVMLGFQRDDGTEIDDRTRKCIILEMILAGTETTATMAEWTMAELFRNPEVMKKMQSELDAVVGTSRFVDEDDMPNLPYLTAVFNESSRLHPPSPLLFPHECGKATQIDGYDIPARSRIFLNTWAIGRDPTVWARPLEFDPERFMDDKSVDHKGQSFKLLPFGAGRRICAGMPLGYSVVKLALAYLVQSFEWSLPAGMSPKDISVDENFGLALTLKHPLRSHLIKPRLPPHLFARS